MLFFNNRDLSLPARKYVFHVAVRPSPFFTLVSNRPSHLVSSRRIMPRFPHGYRHAPLSRAMLTPPPPPPHTLAPHRPLLPLTAPSALLMFLLTLRWRGSASNANIEGDERDSRLRSCARVLFCQCHSTDRFHYSMTQQDVKHLYSPGPWKSVHGSTKLISQVALTLIATFGEEAGPTGYSIAVLICGILNVTVVVLVPPILAGCRPAAVVRYSGYAHPLANHVHRTLEGLTVWLYLSAVVGVSTPSSPVGLAAGVPVGVPVGTLQLSSLALVCLSFLVYIFAFNRCSARRTMRQANAALCCCCRR